MIKSFFKKYAIYFQQFVGTFELMKIQAIQQVAEYNRLKSDMRATQPENPALSGRKIYSQTDEDGIIEEIFNRIPNNKTFLEIGIQTGVECNSHYLLLKDWKGIWVEGSEKYCQVIEKRLGGRSFTGKLDVVSSFINRDNIVGIFKNAHEFLQVKEIDFFSLDIDGNDYHIMEELFKNNVFPKVVCVEYNAKFHPPHRLKVAYNPAHIWDETDYMGCSLQAYTDLFNTYNYTLVCCNIPGINAFYVRNEFASAFTTYSIEELYQPYRFYLSPITAGHKSSLHFLKNKLNGK